MEDKEINIEEDAIRYANTQPTNEWNSAKIGYMAGARDNIWEGDQSFNKDEVAIIYELVWAAIGSEDDRKNKLIDGIRSKLEMADILIIKKIRITD